MPIYEYECRDCKHRFEAIVRLSEASACPPCPACQSASVERLISLFAVDAPGTRSKALSAIQKTNAKVSNDKAWADFEYDKKHRHE
jgi:putative FmdB family regulatory protein